MLSTAYSSADASAIQRSAQMDDKLILVNGEDRNLFTADGSAFSELVSLIEQGETQATATPSPVSGHRDTNIDDWVVQTDVQINDLLFDASLSAFAVITDVRTSSLLHTAISAAGVGLASGGAAKAGGDRYELHDLVELNVVPVASQDPDNIAVAATGTSAARIEVSGVGSARVDFSDTEMRIGDYLRNTTRTQIARITGVSGNEVRHTTIGAQASGDSVIFLKSAMPVADNVHVHYGRVYYRDARDQRKLRISGPNDPQDMTTDAGTLDSSTFRIGAQESEGDIVVGMASFQQFIVLAGKRRTWLFSGIDPIADTSADSVDFSPNSVFPEGIKTADSVLTIGNDGMILTPNGLQSFSVTDRANLLPSREILSNAIRSDIQAIVSGSNDPHPHVIHYPRRNWVIVHGHDDGGEGRLFVFNFAPNLAALSQFEAEIGIPGQRGSWSKFEGRFANMQDYRLNSNDELLCVDTSGRLFRFDDDGVYDDAGSAYATELQTAWYGLDEPRGRTRPSRLQKFGTALMPTIEGSSNLTYTIAATAGFDRESSDSLTVTLSAADAPLQVPRLPLRFRGERVRYTITTNSAAAETLSTLTVRYNKYGVR